jgi:hypothetical protein
MKSGWFIGGLVAIAIFVGYAAWAIRAGWNVGASWARVFSNWPAVAVTFVVIAAAVGVAMWLIFFSARRGYDKRARMEPDRDR